MDLIYFLAFWGILLSACGIVGAIISNKIEQIDTQEGIVA